MIIRKAGLQSRFLLEITALLICADIFTKIFYLSTFDCERTLAAKLFVSSEYLLLCNT